MERRIELSKLEKRIETISIVIYHKNDKKNTLEIFRRVAIISINIFESMEPKMRKNEDSHFKKDTLESSLRVERDKLQQEIKQLRKEIEAKESQCRAKEERLGHVQALLTDEPSASSGPPPRRPGAEPSSTPTPQLLEMAEQVLRERKGEPMHYRDLADEMMQRGAVILGQDPAGALVSRMTQDDNRRAEEDRRFIRPTSKGFYALREDYPDARNVGARRHRKRSNIATEGSK